MNAGLLARLIEAGTPAALVAEVAMLAARADADRAALEQRRSADRARQSSRRHAMSRDVTGDSVTQRDVTDGTPSPAPSPSLPPDPQPNPAPTHTPARDTPPCEARVKRSGFAAPAGVTDSQWQSFLAQRRKKLTDRAYGLLVEKLAKLADAGWPPGEMIDRAWETVFEPKEHRHGQRSHHERPAQGFGDPYLAHHLAGGGTLEI